LPDVLIVDAEMPRMGGLHFLRIIMAQKPLPIIMCATHSTHGKALLREALARGAANTIEKPKLALRRFFDKYADEIIQRVRDASTQKTALRRRRILVPKGEYVSPPPRYTADAVLSIEKGGSLTTTDTIIAVGASTGGIEALKVFIEALPLETPGVVVVQHMPEKFTGSFSARLDDISTVNVKEAENGDKLERGKVLIAPGNKHLLVKRRGHHYYVEIVSGDLVNRHRPSVDVLFRSVANVAGKNAIGVIMTGMGDDGARGMREMKNNGAYNIAQDEKTCVVYGMPKEAVEHGAVDIILPLESIAKAVLKRAALMEKK
ncbi:MAG TPA: chemotaxis-specific protein-glutamate methyltransferase CheB, partial [Turneriella sp.]|nr:chemotaxis-specific protein-glutamate methyltransferase CheB [Turneriella sp.]